MTFLKPLGRKAAVQIDTNLHARVTVNIISGLYLKPIN